MKKLQDRTDYDKTEGMRVGVPLCIKIKQPGHPIRYIASSRLNIDFANDISALVEDWNLTSGPDDKIENPILDYKAAYENQGGYEDLGNDQIINYKIYPLLQTHKNIKELLESPNCFLDNYEIRWNVKIEDIPTVNIPAGIIYEPSQTFTAYTARGLEIQIRMVTHNSPNAKYTSVSFYVDKCDKTGKMSQIAAIHETIKR